VVHFLHEVPEQAQDNRDDQQEDPSRDARRMKPSAGEPDHQASESTGEKESGLVPWSHESTLL
jgi:hypothetical protein